MRRNILLTTLLGVIFFREMKCNAEIKFTGKYWDMFREEFGNELKAKCYNRSMQSPIDLPRKGIKATFESLGFVNYNTTLSSKYSLTNNGHTAMVHPQKATSFEASILGGGLNSVYKLSQFHFHWGKTSASGAEHRIGGSSFPMELHLVHFNTRYGGDLIEAIRKGNGSFDTLAVLSVLYNVSKENNHALESIVSGLSMVKNPDKVTPIKSFPLNELLPRDRNSYYRYMGSLTTPLCDEIVVWTVFKEQVFISEDQLKKFRDLYTNSHTHLVDINRDIQSIHGRLVYDVSSKGENLSSKMSALKIVSQLFPKVPTVFNNVSFNFYIPN